MTAHQANLTQPVRQPASRVAPAILLAEWRLVLGITLALLVFTSLPYVYGYLSAPPGQRFMGILLDVPDHTQYFAWMRDLARADLIENKLTPEPNRAIFFNLLWWMLGRLGLWVGTGYAGMYQVLRFTATALFLPVAYHLIARFIPGVAQRRTAFLLVAFGSGLGWALVVLKYALRLPDVPFPLDLYVAEGNTFLGVLGYPHFIAAALYIVVFDLFLQGEAQGRLRYSLVAGLVALFLGWQHAYDLVSVFGVLGAYGVLKTLRDRRIPPFWIRGILLAGLISVWPALYSVWLTTADPIWKQVLAQFANAGVYTPEPLHLLLLFGGPLLLAIYAAVRQNPIDLKPKDDLSLFLLAWFLITFLLIYLPVDFQIHLLNGWQIPVAILAVRGLHRYGAPWLEKLSRYWKQPPLLAGPERAWRALSVILILAVIPTNLYLWAWRFVDLSRHAAPYYLSTDELAALGWLEGQGNPEQVVLSSETLGQYIPMLTGKHAFLAHWAQTLEYFAKKQAVEVFFASSGSQAERLSLLEQYQVSYIVIGPAERRLGDAPVGALSGVVPAYARGQVTVYAVEHLAEAP